MQSLVQCNNHNATGLLYIPQENTRMISKDTKFSVYTQVKSRIASNAIKCSVSTQVYPRMAGKETGCNEWPDKISKLYSLNALCIHQVFPPPSHHSIPAVNVNTNSNIESRLISAALHHF